MAAFTYTAKRNIEKNGFSASGSDISADTTDDSFNTGSVSPATNLSGSADDEWIYVEGFTEAANNGWFQINGTPIHTKIIQDTSNLTTESAGSPATEVVTITGYKRGSGQSYSFDLSTTNRNRSLKTRYNQNVSLDGTIERLHHSRWEIWNISTAPILRSNLGQVREFIESVIGGESFNFDPYGTVATPDDPLVCTLESNSYNEVELNFSNYFVTSFNIRHPLS